VDNSDYYVLVVANTAASGTADVLYQYATYSVNSSGELGDVLYQPSHNCLPLAVSMPVHHRHSPGASLKPRGSRRET
jgi:hypothetical protein